VLLFPRRVQAPAQRGARRRPAQQFVGQFRNGCVLDHHGKQLLPQTAMRGHAGDEKIGLAGGGENCVSCT
jgi:hypothetical protein